MPARTRTRTRARTTARTSALGLGPGSTQPLSSTQDRDLGLDSDSNPDRRADPDRDGDSDPDPGPYLSSGLSLGTWLGPRSLRDADSIPARGSDLPEWPQPQTQAPDPDSLPCPDAEPSPGLRAPGCRLRLQARLHAGPGSQNGCPRGARPGLCFGPSPADSALRTRAAWRRRLEASLPPELVRTAATRGKRRTPAPPPARAARSLLFGPCKDHRLPSWPRGCLSWGRRVRPCCPGSQARSGGLGGWLEAPLFRAL